MAPIRLRHPRGVVTLDIDPDTQTVDDLRAVIFSTTEIPPSRQDIKYGYPPKPIAPDATLLASVPITRGEQIIVTESEETPDAVSAPAPPVNTVLDSPTAQVPRDDIPETPAEVSESVAVTGIDGGFLQLRVVPDDNSCLFSALGVVFEGGIEGGKALREVAAKSIEADPESYPDVVLGMPRKDYISKIRNTNTWGGAIELAVFANHFRTEVASFDVATGRCDRFGQGEYESRCILIYSGIHYDAATYSPLPVSPASFHTSVFSIHNQPIMAAADQLVAQLKSRHYYTDTSSFDLRCGVCGIGLKGETEAREHARQTGHVDFGEY